jgi:hypothetical protein
VHTQPHARSTRTCIPLSFRIFIFTTPPSPFPVQWREALAYNRGFPLDEDDFAHAAALPPGAAAALGGRIVPIADARDWRANEDEDAAADVAADVAAAAAEHEGAPQVRNALQDVLALTVLPAGGGVGGGGARAVLLSRLQVRRMMRQLGLGVPAGGTLLAGQLPVDSDSEAEEEGGEGGEEEEMEGGEGA